MYRQLQLSHSRVWLSPKWHSAISTFHSSVSLWNYERSLEAEVKLFGAFIHEDTSCSSCISFPDLRSAASECTGISTGIITVSGLCTYHTSTTTATFNTTAKELDGMEGCGQAASGFGFGRPRSSGTEFSSFPLLHASLCPLSLIRSSGFEFF